MEKPCPGAMQNEAEDLFNSAARARAAGAGAEAERLCRLAATAALTDPIRVQSLLLLGVLLAERGAFQDAERALRDLLELDSACCDALTWLATLLRIRGQPQEAIELCLRAVALQPENADAHLLLGLCYLLRLRGLKAVAGLRRTIELQPNQMVAHRDRALSVYHFLGLALRLAGKDDEAIAAFEEAVSRNPSVPDSYVLLGQMMLRAGRHPAAKAYFNRAYETAAGSWEHLESLAFELAGEG